MDILTQLLESNEGFLWAHPCDNGITIQCFRVCLISPRHHPRWRKKNTSLHPLAAKALNLMWSL